MTTNRKQNKKDTFTTVSDKKIVSKNKSNKDYILFTLKDTKLEPK